MHTEVDRTRLLGSAAQSLPATCRTLPDAKRPYLDWRLFSLLRHLCDSLKVTCFELDARKGKKMRLLCGGLRCRVMRRFLDDPKLCQETLLTRFCF